MDKLTIQAINAVFAVKVKMENAEKLEKASRELNLKNDFINFSSMFVEGMLIDFLDKYFASLLPEWEESDAFDGLVSYALYDAAKPFIDEKAYDLTTKDGFINYVKDSLENGK